MRDRIKQLNDEYNDLLTELKDMAKRPHLKRFVEQLMKTMELKAITQSYQQLRRETAEEIAIKNQNAKEHLAWLQGLLPPPDQTEEEES